MTTLTRPARRRSDDLPDAEALEALIEEARRRARRRRLGYAAAALVATVVAVLAAYAFARDSAVRPNPRAERVPVGPGRAVAGSIAYNDGTGVWVVDLRKPSFGVFSPSDHPNNAVRLAGPGWGDPIAWSLDGSRLLVARQPTSPGSGGELIVLHADGTKTRVTASANYGAASISPDGTRVVYAAGFHPSRLELATVRGGRPEVLLSSEDLDGHEHLGSPAFSPDGARIVFIQGGYDHSNALWLVDTDGDNRRKLAGGDWSHVEHLAWSPDGARLAFSCRCPEGTGVYTIRADGTRLTLVSRADERMPMPQWSPDGSRVAFVHDENDFITAGGTTTGRLVLVGAEGGEERELLRLRLARVDDQANLTPVTIAWNHAGRAAERSVSP